MKALQAEHVPAMAELHVRAFGPEQAWGEKTISDLLGLASGLAYGFWTNDRLQALILLQISPGTADILTLATHPDWQRRGLARDLLRQAENELAPLSVLKWTLEVAADNLPALSFYQAYGFKTDGQRRQYYRRADQTRVDGVLMSCRFAGH